MICSSRSRAPLQVYRLQEGATDVRRRASPALFPPTNSVVRVSPYYSCAVLFAAPQYFFLAQFSASLAACRCRIVSVIRTRRNARPDHGQTRRRRKQCKARGLTRQALVSRRRRAKHFLSKAGVENALKKRCWKSGFDPSRLPFSWHRKRHAAPRSHQL